MAVRTSRVTDTLTDGRTAVWAAAGVLLLVLQVGALANFVVGLGIDAILALPGVDTVGFLTSLESAVHSIPTLLSRETIPNQGYYDGSGYEGTFLGLAPAMAWALRAALIYLYAFAAFGWVVWGLRIYRQEYRAADWTPRDDMINRFRGHKWGIFGLVIVFMFVTMAVFAPALGPTTVDQNMRNTYGHEISYWDSDTDSVETVVVGQANLNSLSQGNDRNIGPWTYDDYGRFHPFGTMQDGSDLFTFLVVGSRISLVIGVLSVALSASIAASLALTSAYYKGRVDLSMVLVSDAVMAMPQLLLLIMLTTVLRETWVSDLYSGGFLLALIFAFTGWTYMWRSIRGPALQISEREWIDAARSFGQTPITIMRKHMLPYVTGYLLIYGSMTLGGAIISIAGLSYLGLGVQPPTPEWGRAVNLGQDYVRTGSWHISLIPGILITLVVTGFNALGDGIRDAIDPQSDSAGGETAGAGGGA
ncbi:ABC transporter permease [Halolamina sp. C58]|uniref:ABC transporter permease n=1 Tax=Halolamina sp. C58 TaxID=3421640 RepID=UPI003EBF08FF